jgi:hypothetical protein
MSVCGALLAGAPLFPVQRPNVTLNTNFLLISV